MRTIALIHRLPTHDHVQHKRAEQERPEGADAVRPLSLADELEMQRLIAELEAFLALGRQIRQHYQAKSHQDHAAAGGSPERAAASSLLAGTR